MHLVGFIIQIYDGARSRDRKIRIKKFAQRREHL